MRFRTLNRLGERIVATLALHGSGPDAEGTASHRRRRRRRITTGRLAVADIRHRDAVPPPSSIA